MDGVTGFFTGMQLILHLPMRNGIGAFIRCEHRRTSFDHQGVSFLDFSSGISALLKKTHLLLTSAVHIY